MPSSAAMQQEYFAQFGPIQEAVIMKDRYTGKSRGFGFVTFSNADDASCVVTAEHHIDGEWRLSIDVNSAAAGSC